MTGGTLNIRIVFVRIDASDLGTAAGGIGQREMASETECPALVDDELGRIRGMIDGGTMAVFTLNDPVRGFIDTVVLVGMAILAVFLPLKFHLDGLPFVRIPRSIPSVHVSRFVDPEIPGNDESPGRKNNPCYRQKQVKGP